MNVIEIDAASNNGVDNIREIREEVVSPILTRGSQSPLDAVLGIHIHIVLVLTAVVQVVLMCFMMAVI